MLKKYLHINCKSSENVPVELNLDNNKMQFNVSKFNGTLNNICLKNVSNFSIVGDSIEYHTSNNLLLSDEQEAYNELNEISSMEINKVTIKYKLAGNLNNPDRLVVLFPSMSRMSNVKYPITRFSSISHGDTTLYLSLQDDYDLYGLFLLYNEMGKSIKKEVITFIKRISSKYQIKEGKMILFGASKGAISAVKYSLEFPKANLICSALIVDFKKFLMYQMDIKKYYLYLFERIGIDINDFNLENNIQQIRDNGTDVHLITGLYDYFSLSSLIFDELKYKNINANFSYCGHDVTITNKSNVQFMLENMIENYTKIDFKVVKNYNQIDLSKYICKDFTINIIYYSGKAVELCKFHYQLNNTPFLNINNVNSNCKYLETKPNSFRIEIPNLMEKRVYLSEMLRLKQEISLEIISCVIASNMINIQAKLFSSWDRNSKLIMNIEADSGEQDKLELFPFQRSEAYTLLSTKGMAFIACSFNCKNIARITVLYNNEYINISGKNLIYA